jgi:hypothetical protein
VIFADDNPAVDAPQQPILSAHAALPELRLGLRFKLRLNFSRLKGLLSSNFLSLSEGVLPWAVTVGLGGFKWAWSSAELRLDGVQSSWTAEA